MSEKISVARNSALASLGMTVFKLAVGLATGSLALISEGVHSGLDFLVTLTTYLSVRVADKPADQTHHYGHGKLENLSAFAESLLLMVTAFVISVESVSRLRHPQPPNMNSPIFWCAIVVMVVSIVVDFSRGLALRRAARKFRSQALQADALHFTIELLSSAVVLASLLLVKFVGPDLYWADPAAAIVVALIMGLVAVNLAKASADVLVDRAPDGLEERIQNTVLKVPGVMNVPRVRARQSGSDTFVDATITVDAGLGLEGGHRVASLVEHAVTENYPQTDILVHVEPNSDPQHDHASVVRELARQSELKMHALRIRNIDGALYIYFHVDFPPEMTIREAHDKVNAFEEAVRLRLPKVAEVESHFEPDEGRREET